MTILTDDNSATPDARSARDNAVQRALAAAIADPALVDDLLDAVSRSRLWLPLPDDGRPVTDGSAVSLPTVTYLGREFVPAFTSADELLADELLAEEPAPGADHWPWDGPRPEHPPWDRRPAARPAGDRPHVVVPAAALAGLLPEGVGIALNPGAACSVPVYPDGVAYLAAARVPAARAPSGALPTGAPPVAQDTAGHLIRVSAPLKPPEVFLDLIRSGLREVQAAAEASAAWLVVEREGEGLVVSVALDDPQDPGSQRAVLRVVQRAAAVARELRFPVDVTFAGEGEPDEIDRWVAASAAPFYRRAAVRSPRASGRRG